MNFGTQKRVRTPTVLQMESSECGAASLAMILGYYGLHLPLEQLRLDCSVSRDGVSAANLLKAGQKYGLEVKAFQQPAALLQEYHLPAIILWGSAHYVVLEGVGEKWVYLNDPAVGKKRISYEEFEKMYGEIILTFTPTASFQKEKIKPPSFPKKIFQSLKDEARPFAFLLLTSACLLLPGFAFPAFLLVFIDIYFSKFHMPWEGEFLGFVLISAFLSGALVWAQLYFLNRLNTKLAIQLTSGFLWRLLRLPITFFENRNAGVISQFMAFNQQIAETLTGSCIVILFHLLFFSFFAFAMFAYDSTIAWIGWTIGLINLIATVLIYYFRSELEPLAQISQAMRRGLSIFGLSNMDSIKIRGGESHFFSLWAEYHTKSLNLQQQIEKNHILLSVLPPFFQIIAWAALLGIGSFCIIHGTLSFGKLMALGILQMNFLVPIYNLLRLSPSILELKKAFQRLDDVSHAPLDIVYQSHLQKSDLFGIPKLKGNLEFQKVTFQYSPLAPPILKEISFTIEPGKRVALVGRNGSGRSTLAKLAVGIYHPVSGQILYGGSPIEKIAPGPFQSSIAYIDQEIFIFAGTIRENITLWNKDVSDASLYEAAKTAFMHEQISLLPGGYEALVSQAGSNFSVSEKEQLQFVRAFLYQPSFLILDKALSRLKIELQMPILNRLKEKGIASLLIEDNVNILRECDEILVLDKQGNISQRGTHQKLKSEIGIYKELVTNE